MLSGTFFAKNIFSPLEYPKSDQPKKNGPKTPSTYLVWENGLSGTFL